jgi:hypothetical protein
MLRLSATAPGAALPPRIAVPLGIGWAGLPTMETDAARRRTEPGCHPRPHHDLPAALLAAVSPVDAVVGQVVQDAHTLMLRLSVRGSQHEG